MPRTHIRKLHGIVFYFTLSQLPSSFFSNKKLPVLGFHLPDKDNCDISTQLFRFLPSNALANCSPCERMELEEPDDGRDDDDCDVTHSPSMAFDALRLNCSKKLSICTSIEFGVPLMFVVGCLEFYFSFVFTCVTYKINKKKTMYYVRYVSIV